MKQWVGLTYQRTGPIDPNHPYAIIGSSRRSVPTTFDGILGMDEDSSAGPSAGVSIRECREMIKKSLQCNIDINHRSPHIFCLFSWALTDSSCVLISVPKVKFLRENLEKSGCKFGDNFIRAINCHNQMAGGYAPSRGVVLYSWTSLYVEKSSYDSISCALVWFLEVVVSGFPQSWNFSWLGLRILTVK